MKKILQSLGIENINYGACVGASQWLTTKDAGKLQSINPATGEEIASVYQCSEDDYDQIMSESIEVFKEWRMVPAPIRGQLVREMAEALREKKDLLGSLV